MVHDIPYPEGEVFVYPGAIQTKLVGTGYMRETGPGEFLEVFVPEGRVEFFHSLPQEFKDRISK